MDPRASGRVRKNYLVNTMRAFYKGQVDTQKIINLRRRNKKDLDSKVKD